MNFGYQYARCALVTIGLTLCGNSLVIGAEQADVLKRIAAVERGLRTPITFNPDPKEGMTLADRMLEHGVPGVSIAVINEGRIEWAKAYGVTDAETGMPVSTDTLFQAASISKPVAAIAALKLKDAGLLTLDGSVNGKLKTWQIPDNDYTERNNVTLRHLLSHGGGLTISGFAGYAVGEDVPATVEILNGEAPANSGPVRVSALPGGQWSYSGGGYTVLQLLMEDATGKDFPQLMHEQVIMPLGMQASTYKQPLPQMLTPIAASGHLPDGSVVPGKYHTHPEMAAAGLWTTPSDLARVAIGVQQSVSNSSNTLLSKKTTKAMLTLQQGGYGLGFGLAGEGSTLSFSHGGSNVGFRCMFIAFAETGQGAVVMTNSDSGGALHREIMPSIASVYNWPGFQQEIKTPLKIDAASLADFAGRYQFSSLEGMIAEVTVDGDGLTIEMAGAMPSTLHYPESDARFFSLSGNEVEFIRGESGDVEHVMVRGSYRGTKLRE